MSVYHLCAVPKEARRWCQITRTELEAVVSCLVWALVLNLSSSPSYLLYFFFKMIYFILCVWVLCLYVVCAPHAKCLVPMEVNKGCQIP